MFPLLWSGIAALLFNLPMFYTIPVIGDLIQHVTYPSFASGELEPVSLGMQQRLMLPALILLAIMSAYISRIVCVKSTKRLLAVLPGFIPTSALLLILGANLPFVSAFVNHTASQDPRRLIFYQELTDYLKRLPAQERLYFHHDLMYVSALISALQDKPMLGGWLASGSNLHFRDYVFRPLGVIMHRDPQKALKMLADLGVTTLVLPANDIGKAFLEKTQLGPGLLKGVYLLVEIPDARGYLYPGTIVNSSQGTPTNADDWIEYPWNTLSLNEGGNSEISTSPPSEVLKLISTRRSPYKIEISYAIEGESAVGVNLAYLPALKASLDDKPLALKENNYNGFIWFRSPSGRHTLKIYRARDLIGWLALLLSCMTIIYLAVVFYKSTRLDRYQ